MNNLSPQEDFILNVLENKKNGHYVELGAFHSTDGSNTYNLEKSYGWTGVSFEIEESRRKEFIENRSNPCYGDALQFNYLSYFELNSFPKQIDFLQVDIDEGYQQNLHPKGNRFSTLHGLMSIPLTQYRFSVITFEHDENMYFKNREIKEMQRSILDSFGYTLIVRSVWEDWWVDPTVVKHSLMRKYHRPEHL